MGQTLADPVILHDVGVVLGYHYGHRGAAGTCHGPWGELVSELNAGDFRWGMWSDARQFLWEYKARSGLSVYLNQKLHLKCRRNKWTMLEPGSSEMTYEEVHIWLFLGLSLPQEPENLLVKDLPESSLSMVAQHHCC